MKKAQLFALVLIIIWSCKNEQKSTDNKEDPVNVTTSIYPENLAKIFDAHGGIDLWNSFKGMYYEIEKPTINEMHTVALKSRKSIINAEYHQLAFDGKNVWLRELDTVKFKPNPRFYYNLMFYFYAMPFILGDNGIHYEDTEPLNFEGKTYSGILISYDSDIGESPEDEYILYYDPDTYKMVWLGYTVTYFLKEKGKEFHFIKYSNWQTVEGLQLPQTMQWYNYENNLPTTKRNDVIFVNTKLTKDTPDDQIFAVVEGATIVD